MDRRVVSIGFFVLGDSEPIFERIEFANPMEFRLLTRYTTKHETNCDRYSTASR